MTTLAGSALGCLPHDAASIVQEDLRTTLDRLDAESRLVCGYALGLWDADGRAEQGGGKGVRAHLVLLGAAATGADALAGVAAAVAVELLHNFTLVHDDLMDEDRMRRHRPSVWAAFGRSRAILAGDALLELSGEVAVERCGPWAAQCLSATVRRLIDGQLSDLRFEGQRQVSLTDCLRMAGDKTAALLACACSLGVVSLGGSVTLALRLAEFGTRLGLAYQLRDDLIGIWGSESVTGKSVYSDLRRGKKSLPVAAALASGTSASRRLAEVYPCGEGRRDRTEPQTEAELADTASMIEQAGGRRWAEDRCRAETAAALAILDELELPAEVSSDFGAVARLLCGRES